MLCLCSLEPGPTRSSSERTDTLRYNWQVFLHLLITSIILFTHTPYLYHYPLQAVHLSLLFDVIVDTRTHHIPVLSYPVLPCPALRYPALQLAAEMGELEGTALLVDAGAYVDHPYAIGASTLSRLSSLLIYGLHSITTRPRMIFFYDS